MSIRWSAKLVVMLTIPPLLWAGNAVVGRIMVAHIPPITLNCLRWALAALLLAPLGWRIWKQSHQLKQRWGYLCLLGFLGVGCYNALQYAALQTTPALNVTLIAASMPLWMLIVGALFYRVSPRWTDFVGACLSLLGVTIVLSKGQWNTLQQLTFARGDVLMLLAVTSWAFYSWLLVRPPKHMQGAERPDWNWAELLFPQVLFGTLWAALAAGGEWFFLPSHAMPELNMQQGLQLALGLLYVAVGPAILAFRFWGQGVAEVGPAVAAFFANLTPLITAILSAALLGEMPQGYHALAFALIAAGIGVSAIKPAAVKAAPANPSPRPELQTSTLKAE